MRKDLDGWHFCVGEEDAILALSRFLIGFEELRARLAPSKYPNLEISDEGYLWFNIDASIGIVEVLAFPFGINDIKVSFIAVSIPCKSENLRLRILEKLRNISSEVAEMRLFADKRGAAVREILAAYGLDQHPQLLFTSDFDEILDLKNEGVFFSYLGVRFPVPDKTVVETEGIIRDIVSRLEGK